MSNRPTNLDGSPHTVCSDAGKLQRAKPLEDGEATTLEELTVEVANTPMSLNRLVNKVGSSLGRRAGRGVARQVQHSTPIPIPAPAPTVRVSIPGSPFGSFCEASNEWTDTLRESAQALSLAERSLPTNAVPPDGKGHATRFTPAAQGLVPGRRRPRQVLHLDLSGSPQRVKADSHPTPMPGTTFALDESYDIIIKSSDIRLQPTFRGPGYVLNAVGPPPFLERSRSVKPAETISNSAGKLQVARYSGSTATDFDSKEISSSLDTAVSDRPKFKLQTLRDPNAGHVDHIANQWVSHDPFAPGIGSPANSGLSTSITAVTIESGLTQDVNLPRSNIDKVIPSRDLGVRFGPQWPSTSCFKKLKDEPATTYKDEAVVFVPRLGVEEERELATAAMERESAFELVPASPAHSTTSSGPNLARVQVDTGLTLNPARLHEQSAGGPPSVQPHISCQIADRTAMCELGATSLAHSRISSEPEPSVQGDTVWNLGPSHPSATSSQSDLYVQLHKHCPDMHYQPPLNELRLARKEENFIQTQFDQGSKGWQTAGAWKATLVLRCKHTSEPIKGMQERAGKTYQGGVQESAKPWEVKESASTKQCDPAALTDWIPQSDSVPASASTSISPLLLVQVLRYLVEQDKHRDFLGILHAYQQELTSLPDTCRELRELFEGNLALVEGFQQLPLSEWLTEFHWLQQVGGPREGSDANSEICPSKAGRDSAQTLAYHSEQGQHPVDKMLFLEDPRTILNSGVYKEALQDEVGPFRQYFRGLGFDWSIQHERLVYTSSPDLSQTTSATQDELFVDAVVKQDEIPAETAPKRDGQLSKSQCALIEQYKWLVFILMSYNKPASELQTRYMNVLERLVERAKREELEKFRALGYEWNAEHQAFVNAEGDWLDLYEVEAFARGLMPNFHGLAENEAAQGRVGDVEALWRAMGFDWSSEQQRVLRMPTAEVVNPTPTAVEVETSSPIQLLESLASAGGVNSPQEAQNTTHEPQADDSTGDFAHEVFGITPECDCLIRVVAENARVPREVVAEVVSEYNRLRALM